MGRAAELAEYVQTIKRESSQTSERREIENLRQIYGDKWYKEQLQVQINYSQPPKQEQKHHDHSEANQQARDLILELDQGDFGLILEALYETIEYRSFRNYNQDEIEPYKDLLNNLERLDKKTLLGKLKWYGLAVKLSYE